MKRCNMVQQFTCNIIWKFPEVIVSPSSKFVQNSQYGYNHEKLNYVLLYPEDELLHELVNDETNRFDCIRDCVNMFGNPANEFITLLDENISETLCGVKESYKGFYNVENIKLIDSNASFTLEKSDSFCMYYTPELSATFSISVCCDGCYSSLKEVGYAAIGVLTALVRKQTLSNPNSVRIHCEQYNG